MSPRPTMLASIGSIIVRRKYCFSVCTLLAIAMCDANIIFGLAPGTKSVKGSKIDIICDTIDAYVRVDIYKTDTRSTEGADVFTLCNTEKCRSQPGYTFKLTARNVTITILEPKRDSDEKWWTCKDSTGRDGQFKLRVYNIAACFSASNSNSKSPSEESILFILAKGTIESTCMFVSIGRTGDSTTEGTTKPLFGNFVQTVGGSVDSCSDQEYIYSVPTVIPVNTTLPENLAKTISLECRIGFPTLEDDLKSPPSGSLQFAVEQVHILPRSESLISIVEKKGTSFSCITSGSRPAATVTWFLETTGQSTRQLGRGDDRYFTEGNDMTVTNSTLMLNTTRVYQGWKLSCEATSFGTNKIKASNPKKLNILYPTSIKKFIGGKVGESQSSGSVTVNEHEDMTGECQVDSNPESSIEISQWGLAIARADNVSVLAFQVLNATCLNNGEIICKGWNDIADSTAVTNGLQLHVRCSPRLQFDTDSIVVARQGTSAVMSLSILAYPVPTSPQWQRLVNDKWEDVRNTTSFVLTYSSLQYNLTVMSVTRQLYGSYNLTVENGVGSPLIFTFKLQNKGKPDVPTDIAVYVVSSTVISVSWTAGYDGEVQQSFYIQYKSSDAQGWTTKEVADHKSDERLSFDLDGLKPATDYMLRIFAANAEGNSSLSETLKFRMKVKDQESNSFGAIIGGIVAGIAALCLIIVGIICIRRRNMSPKESATDYTYAVVNKKPTSQQLAVSIEAHTSNENEEEKKYVNQGFEAERNSPQKKKKPKKNKGETKQKAPRNLNQDGLHYADLSFDNTGAASNKKPKKIREERVVYDAVQIGVVGDAYKEPENEKDGNENKQGD